MMLFVYGTLRTGGSNHHLLASGGAALAGVARTLAVHELFDLGAYPGMVAGGHTSVTGEVYVIDERLRERLDAFEGHPRLFRRETILLEDQRPVQTYLFVEANLARNLRARRIDCGDWMVHTAGGAERP